MVMTQLEQARNGAISDAVRYVAAREKVATGEVARQVALGHAVIPSNPSHANLEPHAVGRLFRTKVNANLGRSTVRSSIREEIEKLNLALEAGADFVMDLSVGEGLAELRAAMIDASPAPIGTVPLYEAFDRAKGEVAALDEELLLAVISDQAAQGIDFMTLHAGLLRRHIELAVKRRMGIVSRGGAITARWMADKTRENPLYTRWNDILDICRRNDVTVSLGDGLRPGCLADASDAAQFAELDVLADLVRRCRDAGVQVMVEGPGHVPFDQIQMNVQRQQEVCDGAPFYVLGPVVTDVAPGYDHITSAIGATAAAFHGASLLCYVTPAEHLGLPDCNDVRQGVVAYRIAAHAADVARGLPGARDWDDAMSDARRDFDWRRQFELAIDGKEARRRYEAARAAGDDRSDFCSMCGREFCAIRASRRLREETSA